MIRVLISASLLLLAACASTPNSDKGARQAYEQLENNLLAADVLRVNYAVTASGAIGARLDGDLVTQKPAKAAIRADGDFNGQPVALRLVADGKRMRGGSGALQFDNDAPVALHDGLLLGLARMGVLHNLAMLTGGAAPQATDGTVRDWVVPDRFTWLDASDDNQNLRGIGFSIAVAGEPGGEVRLWFDTDSGLPVLREQLVHFETGDMQVSEHYEFVTGGIIGPCRFDIESIGQ